MDKENFGAREIEGGEDWSDSQKMKRASKLEKAVNQLSEQEYREFRQRFLEKDWEKWNQQIEADSKSAKLDILMQEDLDAKKRGELQEL